MLDFTRAWLNGSHTPAKSGDTAVGCQERKKRAPPTPRFWPTPGTDIHLRHPPADNHHDAFGLAALFAELFGLLESATSAIAGLFLHAASGIDTREFRAACAARDREAGIARPATSWQPDDAPSLPKTYPAVAP